MTSVVFPVQNIVRYCFQHMVQFAPAFCCGVLVLEEYRSRHFPQGLLEQNSQRKLCLVGIPLGQRILHRYHNCLLHQIFFCAAAFWILFSGHKMTVLICLTHTHFLVLARNSTGLSHS